MARIEFRNSSVIEDYSKPYIVAEINTSHFGNVENAKLMIDKAVEAGVDCVKFQSWTADSLYSKDYYDENPVSKRFFKKFSLSENELAEVAGYSTKSGIDFSSTPYSIGEVDFLLEKCNVPYIKIASMDLTNLHYLEYISKTGAPIVLSTGMGDLAEIKNALRTIENSGNENICLLHCISIYPPDISTVRLNNILGLRDEFPDYPIGFSDHSLGIEIAPAAVALGAAMIEKHLTLDKSKIGMDNQMAIEPDEMKSLVENCHNVSQALGGKERIVNDTELEQRTRMRRSVVAANNLTNGTILKISDLDVKRPGTGVSPDKLDTLLGKKIKRDIDKDYMIKISDVIDND